MSIDITLRNASVQEIQLELLRRTTFNAFEGEQVYASLLRNQRLWNAVLLDRPGVPNYATPSHLLMGGLIKLRDLPDNIWNADTLYILTPNRQSAGELMTIIETEDWGGEAINHTDLKETDQALGTGRQEYGLVTVWWD